MVKKSPTLSEYIGASDASQILSKKHGRFISVSHVYRLSKRKYQPIRTERIGDRLMYNKHDIESCIIRKRESEY